MKLGDQFRTGWRNLSRQKLRTSLTIFAIVIGALSVTVMLSLVTSAQGFLTSSFEKTGEDRRVIATPQLDLDYGEARWQTWADGSGKRIDDETVRAMSGIAGVDSVTGILGASYFESVRAGSREASVTNTPLIAYAPNGTVRREILAGRGLEAGDDSGGILVSRSVAGDLGYADNPQQLVGRTVTLIPRKDFGDSAREQTATVRGVMLGEDNGIDMTLAFGKSVAPVFERCEGGGPNTRPVCIRQSEFDRNGYGAVYLSARSTDAVTKVARGVERLGYGAAAGQEEIDAQTQAFTIIGLVLGGIGAIALLVAAIGVINTMVMATLERTREIGIMRAIGATKKTIRRLFTVEAGVLGFMGGVVGVILSFGVAVLLNSILNQQLADSGITDRNIVSVPPTIAVAVIAVTTLIGMLAGRLPARRAANLDPVEALRYE
ncbi:MAG: ABC transporter permease [Actinomycetota bacterium]